MKNCRWFVFEAKHQERYTPPPFEGHGLPLWQAKARLRFQDETNVKAVLMIFEKNTGEVFVQRLDKLEQGKYFDTKGAKPRRIYKLDSFKRI